MIKIIKSFSMVAVAAISLLILTMPVLSEEKEYKVYVVKKGDTLWAISARELKNPLLWPKLWKENPQIKNPDFIYPGWKIKIPVYLTRKEVTVTEPPVIVQTVVPSTVPVPAPIVSKPSPKPAPSVVVVRPVEKEYLIERDALISSGYIEQYLPSKGSIVGAPSERTIFGAGDYVYVVSLYPARANDRFYVVRPVAQIKHPITGAKMGDLINFVGVAEVIGFENGQLKVKIVASYRDIEIGDLLTDYYEVEPPFLTEIPRRPDISGYIVATRDSYVLNSKSDIVFIDKGRANGVEAGDIFSITSRNQYNVPNGYIQVVSVREYMSTAIIRQSDKEVQAGDSIGPFAKPELLPGSVAALSTTTPIVQPAIVIPDDVNLFIGQYISAYESGDIDRFMSLYSRAAIENGILYYADIRRAYEKNFQRGRFIYTLTNQQMQRADDRVALSGSYTIKTMRGDTVISITRGHVRWTLVKDEGRLKIIRIDYDKTG